MFIFHWKNVYLAPQDRPKTTQRPRQDRPVKKQHFFIKNIDFSLEKCRFGAKKGVSHCVLRRERAVLEKNVDLAMTLAMGTFTENPCARMTIL